MSKNNVTLGDGLTDIGYSYSLGTGTGTDFTSQWDTPLTYLSGGYTSSGTVASTARPGIVSNLQLRLGGTYGGYSGTNDGSLQMSTEQDGAGGTTATYGSYSQTATTKTFTSGTIDYPIDTSRNYYYGADSGSTDGNFLFARSTTGAVYRDGTLLTAGNLSGQLTYETIPSKPVSISASNVLQTTLTLDWTAPLDDGVQDPSGYSAANIKGYRIAYKANASPTWLVYTANTGTSTLTGPITGLSVNTKYDFQISALNKITDKHAAFYSVAYSDIAAAVGERSDILTVTTLASAPKLWNGTAWTATTLRVWNGSSFSNADIKVWNGSAWTPLIL